MKKLLLVLVSVLAFSIPALAAVDLNTATQSQLEGLDGVGPKKAQAIIDYRKKMGPFKSVDELDKVPGFGEKTVTKLKKDITVGNTKAATAGKPDKMVKKAKPVAKPTAQATEKAKADKAAMAKKQKAEKAAAAKKAEDKAAAEKVTTEKTTKMGEMAPVETKAGKAALATEKTTEKK